jgi:hypothetical protein
VRGGAAARESCRSRGLGARACLDPDGLLAALPSSFQVPSFLLVEATPDAELVGFYRVVKARGSRTVHAAQIFLAFVPGTPWDGKKAPGSSPTHPPRPCQSPTAGAVGQGIVTGSRRTTVSFVLVPSGMWDRSVGRGTGERCDRPPRKPS